MCNGSSKTFCGCSLFLFLWQETQHDVSFVHMQSQLIFIVLCNQIIHDLMTVISLLSPIGMYWYMEDRMYLNML